VKIQERNKSVVNWVLTTIVKLDKPKRPVMLSKFIVIAKYCKDLRNFNGAMQIMNAIENTILLQFDGTWEGLNQKYVPILLELRKLISKTCNFANMMREMRRSINACVPCLSAILKDLENIDSTHQNFLDSGAQPENVNFEKYRETAKVLAEIRQYQSVDYILQPVHSIQSMLLNLNSLATSELDALAHVSRYREEMLGMHSLSDSINLELPPNPAPELHEESQ